MKPIRSKKYMIFLRTQPCMICMRTDGTVVAHHWQFKGQGGMGTKVSDMQCVALCSRHHSDVHTMGRETFMQRYMLEDRNLVAAIEYYNKKWEER